MPENSPDKGQEKLRRLRDFKLLCCLELWYTSIHAHNHTYGEFNDPLKNWFTRENKEECADFIIESSTFRGNRHAATLLPSSGFFSSVFHYLTLSWLVKNTFVIRQEHLEQMTVIKQLMISPPGKNTLHLKDMQTRD